MENNLKLFPPLSLKQILLRKVAALFCSNSDFLNFFYQPSYSRLLVRELKEWLGVTEERMLKLGLPKELNKQVIDRIQAIGFGIREWKRENKCLLNSSEDMLLDMSKLCLTSTGEINYRKLAEQHVLWDRLTVWQRYCIACRHCMENHIPLLWHELSEEEKESLLDDQVLPGPYCFWPYILRGQQSMLDGICRDSGRNQTSFNQWAFEESAEDDNQVAAEYFFGRLTPEERGASLMRAAYKWIDFNVQASGTFAYYAVDGSVLFYLLSLMNPEQQMEIVRAWPIHVLLCFLDWPRQHLLPENSGLVWAHLPQNDFGALLKIIAFTLRHKDKDFPKFLREFFLHAPPDFIKESFLGPESDSFPPACHVLCALLEKEDLESIGVMFRHADATSKVKLMLCNEVFGFFYHYISSGRWDLVEACLREADLPRVGKGALKDSFVRFLDQTDGETSNAWKFRRFFKLLNETDVKRAKLE